MDCTLSITNSWSLLKFVPIKLVMPSNHLILYRPLLLSPSIFPSIRVFSNESVLCIRWPKDWSFSFSISPSNEYSGLISFSMDWLDLLAVQGTLKSLLQHHSSNASILRRSDFFRVQVSHPHTSTGKTRALTRRTFVSKVMSLLFNMLSRLVTLDTVRGTKVDRSVSGERAGNEKLPQMRCAWGTLRAGLHDCKEVLTYICLRAHQAFHLKPNCDPTFPEGGPFMDRDSVSIKQWEHRSHLLTSGVQRRRVSLLV